MMKRTTVAAHAAVLCAALAGFMNLYCTQAIYPELQRRFGLTVTEAGALLTATTLGLALAAPFAGRVASRYGPRFAVLAGISALTISSVLFGFASERISLVSIRLFQGLMIPVVLSALLASINAVWTDRAALAISATYVTGTVVGGLFGRFLPALVMPSLGWQGAFAVFGGTQILLLAVVWTLYPRVVLAKRQEVDVRTWLAELLPLLRTRLTGVSTAGFCLLFAQTAVTTYIAVRLASPPYNWGIEALGALYAVFLPALVFVRLTPRVMVRLGPNRTLCTALGLGWVGLALTLSPSVILIITGLIVFSIAIFVGQTVLSNVVGSLIPAKKEMAAGIYLGFYYLGGSVGALAPALLWSHGAWPSCIALIALTHIIGISIIKKSHGNQVRSQNKFNTLKQQ